VVLLHNGVYLVQRGPVRTQSAGDYNNTNNYEDKWGVSSEDFACFIQVALKLNLFHFVHKRYEKVEFSVNHKIPVLSQDLVECDAQFCIENTFDFNYFQVQ